MYIRMYDLNIKKQKTHMRQIIPKSKIYRVPIKRKVGSIHSFERVLETYSTPMLLL